MLPAEVAALISQGENHQVEFKASLRYDVDLHHANPAITQAVVRSIASFANSNGGTLLIGVADSGTIVGLSGDLSTFTSDRTLDNFERTLRSSVRESLGVLLSTTIDINFIEFEQGHIACITCPPHSDPIYMGKDQKYFVRDGASTQLLKPSDKDHYITRRSHIALPHGLTAQAQPKPRPRYLVDGQRHIMAFIIASDADQPSADILESTLTRSGYTVTRDSVTSTGNSIGAVSECIAKAHFVVVAVSPSSYESRSVQRQLGLARTLQSASGGYRPAIIPVLVGGGARDIAPMPMMEFDTGAPLGTLKLSDLPRVHGLEHLHQLIELMRPILLVSRMDFFDRAVFDETDVFSLYESLFPASERDHPDDIVSWCLHEDLGKRRLVKTRGGHEFTYQLDSRYCILSLAGKAVGLGFFTYDHSSALIYGNYIGVEKSWRSGGIAEAFVRATEDVFTVLFPAFKGIVFEVEKVDQAQVASIVADLQFSGRRKLTSAESDAVRRFIRVCIYEKLLRSKLFFSNKDDHPFTCTSPSLDPEATPREWDAQKEDYWLMWRNRPNQTEPEDITELLRKGIEVVYVEVLAKSLTERFPKVADQYWAHASSAVAETLARLSAEGVRFDELVGRRSSDLWRRWHALQIDLPL